MATNLSKLNMTGGSVPPLLKYKIVFLGDQAVGKSSIINRFIYDIFDGNQHRPTIGIDFISQNIYLQEKTIRLQLWDTAGQQRFRSLIPNYIRDSTVTVLVYDVTNRATFNSIGKWIEDVKNQRGSDIIICLVANKVDVTEREVSEQEGVEMAQKHQLLFKEMSAKSGLNIQQFFKEVAARLPGTTASEVNKSTFQNQPHDQGRIVIDKQSVEKQTALEKKKCCS